MKVPAPPTPDRHGRILVVEDEPTQRVLLKKYLGSRWEVDAAPDARQALAAALAKPPDLLLVDLVLPDQDGLEFVSKLRRQGLTARVLFLSGLPREEIGPRLGSDDYMAKPFRRKQLLDRVSALLAATFAGGGPPAPFRAVLPEGNPDGLWSWEPDGGTLAVTGAPRSWLGCSAGAHPRLRSVWQCLSEPDRQWLRRAAKTALNPAIRRPFAVECLFMGADGGRRWVSIKGGALFSGPGPEARPQRLIGTAQDVTDRKQAERLVREQASLFGLADDAVVLTDARDKIIAWEGGAEKMYGWTQEEAVGRTCGRLLRTIYPLPLEAIKDRVDRHGCWQGLLRQFRRDGEPVEAVSRWTPARKTKDGRTLYVQINTDASARRRAVDRIISARIQAEEGLHERSVVLDRLNARLSEARRQAMDAALTKARLLTNVSHELRTPLNAIIGLSSLLLDSPLTPEQKDHLETVRRSGDSLLRLIQRLLEVADTGRGSSRPRLRAFSPRQLVQATTQLFGSQAREKGLALTCRLDPLLPKRAVADETAVGRALEILLENALKFTDRGGIDVRAALKEEEGRRWMRVEVADTGIGVPPDDRKRIFLPLTQGDESMTRRFGGAGLGLALARRALERTGGRLDCAATAERGALFWFESPLEAAAF
ncbi:MAG: ATP-binding protein [Elusimicrobiota bacterium]